MPPAHVATLWEIALDAGFTNIVVTDFETQQILSYINTTLAVSTNYWMRATYYFADGSTAGPGAATAFTTTAGNTLPPPNNTQWDPCT